MIVPRTRLLFWAGVILLPCSLLGAWEASALVLTWAAAGALVALALADAFAGRKRLAGLSVEFAPVTRMSKDRESHIELRIRNRPGAARQVRLALVLPPEVVSTHEDIAVALPGGVEWSRVNWACVPQRRGNFRVRSCWLETLSPLGFWGARKGLSGNGELRVYPNLLSERRDLAALFLHRGSFGFHARRQIGKGREFEKLREYSPGDSFDEVHWKATARRGRPITKVFQIERTQELYVVIDTSRLSSRVLADSPSTPPPPGTPASSPGAAPAHGAGAAVAESNTTLERFITAALLLGLAAEQQGDFFGVLTFSDQVGRFVRARNGKAHYNICRDALYTLEPRMVSPDYDEVCTFIRLRLRRRALLIFLTALDDPALAESFVRNMGLICRQHVVLVNMLQPPGVAPLFSTPDVASIDEVYQHLGGHLQWQSLRELEKVLHRRGVRFNLLKHERLSAQLTAQYLDIKRRQLL